jgi:cell volume regulation protein A
VDPVTLFLLVIAGTFLIGAIGEIVFERTNIPDVIWLILAGILVGPVGGLVTRADLARIAPYFAALTLVVILFEGGLALRLADLAHSAPRSGVLAILSFLLSVAGVAAASMAAAVVGWLPGGWSWTHGLLLGAILGGSSSIIIMPAVTRARLAPGLANLISLESALTDALCVVGTGALIRILLEGAAGEVHPGTALFKSFGMAVAIGLVSGLAWLLFLWLLHAREHAYPITLSALLVLYVVIDRAGGSAALGILTVAVVLGNAGALSRLLGISGAVELDTSVRGFHRQMAFIIKSFFFVFIGAMLGPPWSMMILGLLLAGVLLAARVPAVYLSTLGTGLTPDEKRLGVIALPRGMAAGVLATLPAAAGVALTENLAVIVFACVLTTIIIFAGGFAAIRRAAGAGPAAGETAPDAAARRDPGGEVR